MSLHWSRNYILVFDIVVLGSLLRLYGGYSPKTCEVCLQLEKCLEMEEEFIVDLNLVVDNSLLSPITTRIHEPMSIHQLTNLIRIEYSIPNSNPDSQ